MVRGHLSTRPGSWRSRVAGFRLAISISFIFALLFASGIESLARHHHEAVSGSHHDCAICRVVVHSVGDAPTQASLDQGVHDEGSGERVESRVDRPVPTHLLVTRLRAPPVAA